MRIRPSDDLILAGLSQGIRLLCAWSFLFVTYLVLAGQVSADELAAGAVCAGAAVLWRLGIRRISPHAFEFNSEAWAAAGRACRELPWATFSVGTVLFRTFVRPEVGDISHQRFVRGRGGDAAEAGRRAVGVLAAPLAPDRFVLRIPAARDEIVFHALKRGARPKDPRWPI